MPHARARGRRAAAAAVVALGALLALLTCARAWPGAADEARAGAVARVTVPGDDAPVAAVTHGASGDDVPGCGEGSASDDGGLVPAAPPRGSSLGDLLPALYDGRGTGAGGCATGVVAHIRPERAPPALVPPSPMDLSILRV
ncbi:hypothetical protein GCM10023237_35300 [Streptomyces coeruleoprunus]